MHFYFIKQIDKILNVTVEVQRCGRFGAGEFIFDTSRLVLSELFVIESRPQYNQW